MPRRGGARALTKRNRRQRQHEGRDRESRQAKEQALREKRR